MQKVRYINSKGESIYFDITPPFVLQTIAGVGEVSANVTSQKSPYQDGATYTGSKLESREIFMQVSLLNSNDSELFKMRQDVQRVFNPKLGEGFLVYENPNGTKMINVVPDGTPIFKEWKNGGITCQITLLAFNPFWTELNTLPTNVTSVSNYISKYGTLPTIPYFQATVTKSGVSVANNGTFDTSLIIEISGATTENVIVTNEENGASLEIVRMIPSGSKLYINTAFGKGKVIKLIAQDGTESNGFPYLSFTSKFLQLEVGENIMKYNTATQDVLINIMWHNCYIGL